MILKIASLVEYFASKENATSKLLLVPRKVKIELCEILLVQLFHIHYHFHRQKYQYTCLVSCK